MNITLLKTLVVLLPACMLLFGSAILFSRAKSVSSFLQLLGAGSLVLVILTHIFEAFQLFPWIHWGLSIALVITSIFQVPFLVSRCFPLDICFMRLQSGLTNW
jgi:hypothetical protein